MGSNPERQSIKLVCFDDRDPEDAILCAQGPRQGPATSPRVLLYDAAHGIASCSLALWASVFRFIHRPTSTMRENGTSSRHAIFSSIIVIMSFAKEIKLGLDEGFLKLKESVSSFSE